MDFNSSLSFSNLCALSPSLSHTLIINLRTNFAFFVLRGTPPNLFLHFSLLFLHQPKERKQAHITVSSLSLSLLKGRKQKDPFQSHAHTFNLSAKPPISIDLLVDSCKSMCISEFFLYVFFLVLDCSFGVIIVSFPVLIESSFSNPSLISNVVDKINILLLIFSLHHCPAFLVNSVFSFFHFFFHFWMNERLSLPFSVTECCMLFHFI